MIDSNQLLNLVVIVKFVNQDFAVRFFFVFVFIFLFY